MKVLVGKFTEAQCKNGEDKKACAEVEKNSNRKLRYFTTKFRRKKGVDYLEVWAMDLDEYAKSPEI